MSAFPALGFDPAPGDLAVVESFVDDLTTACDGIDDALVTLDGSDDSAWIGKAASAFRASMSEDFRPQLVDTGDALTQSRDALRGWAQSLAAYQRRATELETRAAEAQRAVDSAAGAKSRAEASAGDEDADPDAVGDAATALGLAEGELEEIRAEAWRLKQDVDDDASATASLLDAAGNLLDDYKGNPFSNMISDAGGWLADAGEWLMDNLVPIVEDILRAALPIVAILGMFFPAFGAAAFIMSAVLVGIDGLQAATGRGSWGEFAVGALGMLAGGALGQLSKSLLGPTGQVVVPSIQRMTPALAGGGGQAAAGSLAITFSLNLRTMASNTYWAFSTAKDAVDNSQSFADSLTGPWRNLSERAWNLANGNGPKTHEERS